MEGAVAEALVEAEAAEWAKEVAEAAAAGGRFMFCWRHRHNHYAIGQARRVANLEGWVKSMELQLEQVK